MNLIFTSFHYKPKANKAHSIKLETYLKNILTALVSAKKQNPDDEVALIVTNETKLILPEWFLLKLKEFELSLKEMEFKYFKGEDDQIWSFSFYRLSIMYELCEKREYENILSIDSDTYSINPLTFAWEDCKQYILLYDINIEHTCLQSIDTNKDFISYLGENIYPTCYGGEFIGFSCQNGTIFIKRCLEIFNNLVQKRIEFKHGDETVLALAAYTGQKDNLFMIKNASMYVFRYWTGRKYYLTSSVYSIDYLSMIHVPDEKDFGLDKLYKKIILKNKKVPINKVAKILGITTKRPVRIFEILKKIKTKIG